MSQWGDLVDASAEANRAWDNLCALLKNAAVGSLERLFRVPIGTRIGTRTVETAPVQPGRDTETGA